MRLQDLSTGEIVAVIAVWTAAFLLVFAHAQRHGSKHATAWGVAAFLAAGIVVPVYFVRHLLRRRRG
ncbi:MAG: hypothetical protein ACM33B_04165 [Pseudomonadota bacterium]